MSTARRRIVRDPAADFEIQQAEVATLEADLAVEETFQTACKTFLEALDTYVRTFPQGLDPCDPDSVLGRALDDSIFIHRAGISGCKSRLKEARVRLKRSGERLFA